MLVLLVLVGIALVALLVAPFASMAGTPRGAAWVYGIGLVAVLLAGLLIAEAA